jgi:hypothetical protein
VTEKKEVRLDFVNMDELEGAPRNPKQHDLGAIITSMRRFGFVAPVVVNETTGNLVVGHGRVEALREIRSSGGEAPKRIRTAKDGVWKVPVVHVAFDTDEEAEAYVIADNRITELGGWDHNELAAVLTTLDDLEGTGYDGDDLDDLLAMIGEMPGPPGGGGEGEDNELWPTIKVRVPPEVYHDYRKVLAQCGGGTEGERFADLLSRVQVPL